MNKDVVYIEPEDDITDILTAVKNSEHKIVALVPPKKAGVLKSAVNFKLLARTARETGKAVVLITTDSALLKLAAVAKIPVAKNLQTKPELPEEIVVDEEVEINDDVIDGEEAAAIVKEDKDLSKPDEETVIESVDLSDESDEGAGQSSDKKKKKSKTKVPNFDKYRKFIVLGAIGLVLIAGFLVWALALAPKATVEVSVRTTARQFSENVYFTTDDKKADVEGGVFLLETQELTRQSVVEFEATGQVDKGEKATGKLTFKRTHISTAYQKAITIPKGTKFTINGLGYITTEAGTLAALDDTNTSSVGGIGNTSYIFTKDVTATVGVEAESPGEKYNIAESSTGWAPSGNGYSIAGSDMTGGTSKLVKVVSEQDVKTARESLESTGATEGRAELLEAFDIGLMPISSSFATQSSEPASSPAVGQEVGEGVKPKLVAETTFTMFGVDLVKLNEYVDIKTMQAIAGEEGQKVYSTGVSEDSEENKAFIESFREADGMYTAKLKTTTKTGPEVTNQMVMEKSLGKKIGEVQSLLKSINGVGSVKVNTSVFWMTSIPNDINKVNVEITVE